MRASWLVVVLATAAWAQNATTPGTPTAPFPTLWNLSVDWPLSGDADNDATVTVRIEEEPQAIEDFADDPLFGMWRDREDMADVAGFVRKLRASRFNDDGTRREG